MGTPSSGKSRGWTDINLNADFISILIQNDPWPASFTSQVISSKRVQINNDSIFEIPDFIGASAGCARLKIKRCHL